jgi:membrane dipeptidase
MLKALAEKNGVIGITVLPGFLRSELDTKQSELFARVAAAHGLPPDYGAIDKADPAQRDAFRADFDKRWAALKKTLPPVDVKTVVDHIDHVVKVTGDADHVGLGSDYDGTDDTPAGLENIGLLPNITRELVARGYRPADIRKILGGNFMRVFMGVGPQKSQ